MIMDHKPLRKQHYVMEMYNNKKKIFLLLPPIYRRVNRPAILTYMDLEFVIIALS